MTLHKFNIEQHEAEPTPYFTLADIADGYTWKVERLVEEDSRTDMITFVVMLDDGTGIGDALIGAKWNLETDGPVTLDSPADWWLQFHGGPVNDVGGTFRDVLNSIGFDLWRCDMPDTQRVWVDSAAHAGRYLMSRQATIQAFIDAPGDCDQWVAVNVPLETANATIDAAIAEGNLVSIDLYKVGWDLMAGIRLHAHRTHENEKPPSKMTHKDISQRITDALVAASTAAKNYRRDDPSIPPWSRASYELGYLQGMIGRLRNELRKEDATTTTS